MLSASEIANVFGKFQPEKMDVFTENPSTGTGGGRFDVLNASDIPCRVLAYVQRNLEPLRAEDLGRRQINWDATFELPNVHCQLEINGERWQPIPGSVRARRGFGAEIWQWTAYVVQVKT